MGEVRREIPNLEDRSGGRGIAPADPYATPAPQREGYYPNLPPYGPSDVQSDELKLTLLRYWGIVSKHRWLIAGIAAAAICLSLIATVLITPTYRAMTTIQIDREAAKVLEAADLEPAGSDPEFYETQYELLKSRAVAERVVATLNLTENPHVMGEARTGFGARILRRLGFGGSPDDRGDLAARQRRAVTYVLDGLTVQPIKSSRLVALSFISTSPALSQKIVDAVANSFISANLERKFDASSYARTFLEERLAQLKLRLEESERQLVASAQKDEIIEFNEQEDLVAADLAAANTELARAKAERIRNEQLWRQAEGNGGEGLPQVLESVVIQTFRDTRAQLSADYQQKLTLFKPAYPEMVELKARIAEIDANIAAEIANIKSAIREKYEASLAEEQALTAHVEKSKQDVLDFRGRKIAYNILQREVDTNRSLYDGLLQRYKEVGVSGGIGTNNVSVIDRAELPISPYSPNLLINMAFALIVGVTGGVLAAVARETLDDTIKSPEDVELKLGLPVLGIIPRVSGEASTAELLKDPRSSVSEAFRSLCTALQFATEDGIPKCLLVTSARPGEGKSTASLALARHFANVGARVLLIDGDLRNPSLHKLIGCENGTGLSTYLSGAARPPELLRKTEDANLTFLPCGPLPPNPALLLAGSRARSLFAIGTKVFDVVIIDGPPIMGLADAPLLASMSAGTLLVTAAGEVRQAVAKQAVRRIQLTRGNVIGVLLNKFDSRHVSYGYGYEYVYGESAYSYRDDATPLPKPGPARLR